MKNLSCHGGQKRFSLCQDAAKKMPPQNSDMDLNLQKVGGEQIGAQTEHLQAISQCERDLLQKKRHILHSLLYVSFIEST